MKKHLFLLCLMVSIANLHAMKKRNAMPSAHNSDDAEIAVNSFDQEKDKLLEELDKVTQDLAELDIKAITLEETIRSKDHLRKFKLLAKLDFKLGRKLKRIKSNDIEEKLAQKPFKKRQKKRICRNRNDTS